MQISVVSSSVLQGLAQCVSDNGGNPARVLEAARLGSAGPDRLLTALPIETFFRALNEAALETLVPLFGLEYGSRFRRIDLGWIAYLFTYNTTLRESLSDFGRYFTSLQTNSHYAVLPVGDLVAIEYEAPGADRQFKAQDAEFSMILQLRLVQFSLGSEWWPRRMEFQHSPLAGPEHYARYLRCPVDFGKESNRLYLSRGALDQKNTDADQKLAMLIRRELAAECDAVNLHSDDLTKIRRCISDAIAIGEHVSLASTADKLSVSAQRLARVISTQNTSFRALLNEEKMTVAVKMLSKSYLSVQEIAEYLGYSETSAFSRAFSRFVGTTPSTLRKDSGRKADPEAHDQ